MMMFRGSGKAGAAKGAGAAGGCNIIPIIPKPKPEPVEINIDLERIEPPVEYYCASAAFETCMV